MHTKLYFYSVVMLHVLVTSFASERSAALQPIQKMGRTRRMCIRAMSRLCEFKSMLNWCNVKFVDLSDPSPLKKSVRIILQCFDSVPTKTVKTSQYGSYQLEAFLLICFLDQFDQRVFTHWLIMQSAKRITSYQIELQEAYLGTIVVVCDKGSQPDLLQTVDKRARPVSIGSFIHFVRRPSNYFLIPGCMQDKNS